MRDAETFIREHVRRILAEEKAEPEGARVVRGRVGGGRFRGVPPLSGSLAEKNPKELVKKLGLEGFTPAGSNAEEKVLSLIQKSRSTAPEMREAYAGAEMEEDENGVPFIRLTPNEGLSPRDAVQYMFLALMAARNVGLLKGINKNVKPGLDPEGQAVIFFAERDEPKKGPAPKKKEPKKEPAAG